MGRTRSTADTTYSGVNIDMDSDTCHVHSASPQTMPDSSPTKTKQGAGWVVLSFLILGPVDQRSGHGRPDGWTQPHPAIRPEGSAPSLRPRDRSGSAYLHYSSCNKECKTASDRLGRRSALFCPTTSRDATIPTGLAGLIEIGSRPSDRSGGRWI